MKIILERMKTYAQHGVLDQERMVGANFYTTVIAETDHMDAVWTDELQDTVSYADIVEVVRQEMATPSRLLEHVTGRIARRLLNDFPTLNHVTVRVIKENPPFQAQCEGAGVEVELHR